MSRRLPNSLSEANLRSVWKDSRDSKPWNPGGPGVDGVKAESFSSQLPRAVNAIRNQIRDGAYEFQPLRGAAVPKKSGKLRIIAVPTVQDRLVQRAILSHLQKDSRFDEASSISYGFAKGRTLAAAHQRALSLRMEHNWVLQADIVQFFDRIGRKLLHQKIDRVRSKIVRGLLHKIVECEIDDRNPFTNSIAEQNGIARGQGLRQGMPASPLLSNLMLKEFDRSMVRDGLAAVRYADDIAVFANSRSACEQALELMKTRLNSLGLSIPSLDDDDKTKISSPSESAEFLGLEIKRVQGCYDLFAPKHKLDTLCEKMDGIADLEYCIEHKRTLDQTCATMDAIIAGYLGALKSASNGDDFAKKTRSSQTQSHRSASRPNNRRRGREKSLTGKTRGSRYRRF